MHVCSCIICLVCLLALEHACISLSHIPASIRNGWSLYVSLRMLSSFWHMFSTRVLNCFVLDPVPVFRTEMGHIVFGYGGTAKKHVRLGFRFGFGVLDRRVRHDIESALQCIIVRGHNVVGLGSEFGSGLLRALKIMYRLCA